MNINYLKYVSRRQSFGQTEYDVFPWCCIFPNLSRNENLVGHIEVNDRFIIEQNLIEDNIDRNEFR